MSIKEQVGGVAEKVEWERLKTVEVAQSALTEFVEEEYREPSDEPTEELEDGR